jgi:hypothetical protein
LTVVCVLINYLKKAGEKSRFSEFERSREQV